MRSAAHLALAALALAACKSESSSNAALHRSSDAPPVVYVDRSAALDLATTKEIEPNDTADKAMVAKIPVAVTGVLSSSDDVDLYRVVPPKDGQLVVRIAELDEADAMIELLDEKGERLAVSDRGPAGTPEGMPNFPVTAKKPYLVAVKEYVKKSRRKKDGPGREGDSPPYRLELRMLEGAPDELEHEPNGELDQAREILLGDRPTGYIGWSGDVDLWKLSLQGFGEDNLIDLSVDGVDGVTLMLTLREAHGKAILERRGVKSGPVYVRGLSPSSSGYLIAEISGKRSHESQPYRIQFATRLRGEGDEVEPNDEPGAATQLEAELGEGSANGQLATGDVDYWELPAPDKTLGMTVAVDGPSGVELELEVKAGGKVLGSASGGGARGKVEVYGVTVNAGKRIGVKVAAKSATSEPASYRLSWSSVAAAPPPGEGSDDPLQQLE